MKVEIGFFFCSNCGHQQCNDVMYEDKPQESCWRCGFSDEWIFEPTGERELETK